MVSLTVTVDGAEASASYLRAVPSRVDRALVRGLNRAIHSARTVETREISRDLGLRAKDVRDKLPVREASFSNPSATLAASLTRIPISAFSPRGPLPSRGRGGGVTYRLKGGRGRIENAFLVRFQSGHIGVFRRSLPSTHKSRGAWSKNLPLYEPKGPSLGHVFEKYRALAQERAQEIFQKNFDHELQFRGGQDVSDDSAGGSD